MRLAVLGFCVGLGCVPEPVAPVSGPQWVIRNVQVFDGERLLGPRDVVVEKERIALVGEAVDVRGKTEVIDGTGKVLLPGLIDSHVHAKREEDLRQMAALGVTTGLDMYGAPAVLSRLKHAAQQERGLADLRVAGWGATVPGGHGTEYGIKVPTLSEASEAQAFVDARIGEGADYLKVIYGSGKEYGRTIPTLSKEMLSAVIAAAHARRKLAVVHIGSLEDARDAIEAGADGLAHTFEDAAPDAAIAKLAAAHHTFVIPTLAVSMSAAGRVGSLGQDPALKPYLNAKDVKSLASSFPSRPGRISYEHAEESVRAFKASGVPILAGTDAPNPGTAYGASLHGELELLVKAGLTPSEALTAATARPAERFHLDDRGRIRRGLRADLLLVEGDPTKDILATRKIAAVWVRGQKVDVAAWTKSAADDRAADEARAATSAKAIEVGLVSAFDGPDDRATFGQGWSGFTDGLAGGKSTATLEPVAGGAEGSRGSLAIAGNVAPGRPYAWAGALFMPGSVRFEPANLSSKRHLAFWVKADGRSYRVMLFTKSHGRNPLTVTFVSESSWKHFTFPLAAFEATDGHDVTGIAIVAGPTPGDFRLQLDDVRLEP